MPSAPSRRGSPSPLHELRGPLSSGHTSRLLAGSATIARPSEHLGKHCVPESGDSKLTGRRVVLGDNSPETRTQVEAAPRGTVWRFRVRHRHPQVSLGREESLKGESGREGQGQSSMDVRRNKRAPELR